MKNFFKFMSVGIIAATSLTLVSCSDDDDDNNGNGAGNGMPKPTEVFTAGVPTSFDGAAITKNAAGLVTQIKSDTETVTFNYDKVTYEGKSYDATLKYTDDEVGADPSDNITVYVNLNSKGFITNALEVYGEGEPDTWTFEYNAAGQLSKMVRSEGGNEVTVLTYTDGNITKVVTTDDEGGKAESNIKYTDATVKTPIVNKGGIMMFDECFDIDMDELQVAYYAGMLGKATKNLPVANDDYTFSWTLNSNGLPTQLKSVYSEYPESYDVYTFGW